MREIASMNDDTDFFRPSLDVISAVAEREECPPSELRPPLYDAIDPEALNRLCDPSTDGQRGADGTVQFTYCGYEVTVASDGEIAVE